MRSPVDAVSMQTSISSRVAHLHYDALASSVLPGASVPERFSTISVGFASAIGIAGSRVVLFLVVLVLSGSSPTPVIYPVHGS